MKKILLFIIAIILLSAPNSIGYPSYNICPSDETLLKNREWIDYTRPWDPLLARLYRDHLKKKLAPIRDAVYFNMVQVYVNRGQGVTIWREVIWRISRSNSENFNGRNNNCRVRSSIAYYAEVKNKNGFPPDYTVEQIRIHEISLVQRGRLLLIEFRWYDNISQKRCRWYNQKAAEKLLQWTAKISPISLPKNIINTLD